MLFLFFRTIGKSQRGETVASMLAGPAGHQEQVRVEKASVWPYRHRGRGPKEGQGEGCPQPDGGPWPGTVSYQCQGPGSPASWLLMLEHMESTRSSLPARAESPG